MNYIDGFVLAVATDRRDDYLKHATAMAAVMKSHGATGVVECWGDEVPEGKLTSFPMAVKCEPGETVVFSWVTWPSRAARDEGWKKVMADPRVVNAGDVPFDGKRMIYGGFEVLLRA